LSVPAEISAQQAFEAGATEIPVNPNKPQILSVDAGLQIALTSQTNTTARVLQAEKLNTASTGMDAVPPELHFLTGYEIQIEGEVQPTITISYDEAQVKVNEKTIKPFKFKDGSWQELPGFVLNHITNSVTFTVNTAETPYALLDDSGATPSCANMACDDGNECTADGCFEGQCVTGPLPNGIACSTGICKEGTCTAQPQQPPKEEAKTTTEETQPAEQAMETPEPTKQLEPTQEPCGGLSCNDNNPCTIDLCKDNACAYAAAIDGTTCANDASCQGGICLKVVGAEAPAPVQDLFALPLVIVLVIIGAIIVTLQIVFLLKK